MAIKKVVRKVRAVVYRRRDAERATRERVADLEARLRQAETNLAAAALRDREYDTERDHAAVERQQSLAERDQATAQRDQAVAERDQATAERDQATAERDQAVSLREQAAAEREHAAAQRVQTVAQRDQAVAERDQATAGRDQATAERDQATAQRDQAVAEREHAVTQRDQAVAEREHAVTQRDQAVAERDQAAAEHRKTLDAAEERHAAERDWWAAQNHAALRDAEQRCAADRDRWAAEREAITAAARELVAARERAAIERQQVLEQLLADAERRTADADGRATDAESQVSESRRAADAERAVLSAELSRVRERFRASSAGLPPTGPRFADAELIASLQEVGVPVRTDDRVTLHVGFGHAATTSLQHAFFAHRDDVFYAGVPYADAGGFFSHLKYTDDHLLDHARMLELCRDTVYGSPARNKRPIAVSDETIAELAEVYYHPHLLPPRQVAARLKRYFPTARVVFTLRRQPDYVASTYFNLKRNYAYQAGQPIPPFDEWWDGMMHTQVRGQYLLNLDYAPLVRLYAELFGRENVLVLPLEELKNRGDAAYLGRLCEFMGVELREADRDHFRRPRNERMTVVEERVAELLSARHADGAVRQALGNAALSSLTGLAARASLGLRPEVVDEIQRRVAPGNRWLAEAFGLPLAEWGYFV